MAIRAIIFDMDGTIVTTELLWREATAQLLRQRKVLLAEQDELALQAQLCGLGLREACEIIKERGNLTASLEELIAEKRELAHSLYGKGITFVNGFQDFHAMITNASLKSGVATNADEDTLQTTNQLVNLRHFFGPHLYSIMHVQYCYKPRPDIYLHVASQLEVRPDECIAIEDSAHGIAAAKAAGMICIGINTSKDRKQLLQADMIIEDYTELTLSSLLGT